MISRDALGIPFVRGDDVFELAAAQGEATAHDRGWQIEVDRRRAEGTLAALIGPAGLDWDVFARRARLDDTARRAFAALGDEDRAFVRAYVDGVRRGMREGAAGTGARAVEFAALDTHFGDRAPLDDWPEHAPLGVLHVAHALFSSFPSVLWAEHVARTVGDDWVDVLTSGDDAEPASGSNAWAVHGSLTSSGSPVLAGDPHRLFELPGVYQQVGLACDEFDVIGLAFPGVPGIAHFGHTGHAAWGITNAMAHSVDVFRERLRRVSGGHGELPRVEALGPDGWRATSVEHSRIEVRGGNPVGVEAIETERGTVVTDLSPLPSGAFGESADFEAWSVRMPARTGRDLGFAALLPLLRARSAADVVAAFGRWVDPVNRLLTADRHGTVLSATVGRAPDRTHAERRLPLDGRSTRPVEDRRMPRAVAVETVAVNANERPTRADVDLGHAYAPPHRARRIRHLLETRRPASVDEFMPIWGDARLGGLDEWLALLPADAELDGLELEPRRARDELLAWDGVMAADSPAAARLAAFREALVERVAALPEFERLHDPHPFGAIFDPWMGARGRIATALPGLLHAPALADRRDALVRDALAAAAAREPESWGDEHRLLPLHVFLDVPGVADPGRDLDVPLSGDGESVRCTGSTPGVTRRSWRGSVARWAWDLADRDNSRWSVPFGASGDPASAHFADQLAGWVAADPPRVGGPTPPPARDIRLPVTSALRRIEPRMTESATALSTDRLTTGPAGRLVHTAHDPALGTIEVFVLDPDAHLDVIHTWVTQPRARFWGLGELSRQELRDLYAYVDELDTHHAFLVFRDGTPVVLLQTYEPEHDPVGECYAVEPGDVGLHFFIGDRGAPVDAFTTRIARVIGDFLFLSPGAARLIVEPDVHNDGAVNRMTLMGFVAGPVIDLPNKQGQLAFMPRERWERMPR